MMSENLTKRQLRNILLTRLKKQTEQQRERKSKLIERKLIKQEEFVRAKRILFYLAFDGEVKTENMINKARELGKEIYVPICDTEKKALRPCVFKNGALLQKGPYQILEPRIKIDSPLEKLDLVLVPALGFDKNGNRLGRGIGYYDRLLKKASGRVHSIGLAFDFQVLNKLPFFSHDVSVTKVISA